MTRIILPFAVLLTGLFVVGCDDENESVVQTGSAQFEKSVLSLSESAEKTTITITLNKKAADDGHVLIQISSSSMEKFQFEPAAIDGIINLPFSKGQSKTMFNVKSLDNDVLDGDKTLDFTITDVSQGYDIGATSTLSTVWVDDETPAEVNFASLETVTRENNTVAFPVTISFTHAAKADGLVSIALESVTAVYGTHFTTYPTPVDGIILLPVTSGMDQVAFHVLPLDDELFNEQRSIKYTIVDAGGGLEEGTILQHELKINDDELEGTAKGYEVIAGNWSYKRRYEYNSNGTISKIYWDKNTPAHSNGVYSYVYDQGGNLEKIIQSPVSEEIFYREGERIVRSDEYTNNLLTKYTLFGYDDAGNVAEAAVHYKQPDGTLKLTFIFVYLYHLDHNVYKVLSYDAVEGSEDPVLISTKTFDNYIDVENPFPMVDILPDQKAQNKLPTSYRVEENGHDITYQFTYTLFEDRPISRTATSSSGSETANYEYY